MKQQSNRLTPNRFELKGKHTEITYETTGFDGQARLNYRVFQGPATRTFTGDQLSSENTRIGTLVTVTLEAQPDLETTTLTLVVPIINLVDATELAFKTLAIITTQRN